MKPMDLVDEGDALFARRGVARVVEVDERDIAFRVVGASWTGSIVRLVTSGL